MVLATRNYKWSQLNCTRLASGFVQENQISHAVGTTGFHNFAKNVMTTIDALRVGKHQAHLLGKLGQARAGIAGCSDDDLWISHPSILVFIVNVRRGC
jgi:hypothetical protein